jgi:GNAT superfamily N-acetyltransferase
MWLPSAKWLVRLCRNSHREIVSRDQPNDQDFGTYYVPDQHQQPESARFDAEKIESAESRYVPIARVHQATMDHLEDLVSLVDGFRQFFQQASDLSGVRTFLAQRLTHNDSVIFIAYLEKGRSSLSVVEVADPSISKETGTGATPAGFVQLYSLFTMSMSLKKTWILEDLFVTPSARNHGVAHALLKHAEQFATDTGAEDLKLETPRDNVAAQTLFSSRKWKRDSRFYTYIYKCS